MAIYWKSYVVIKGVRKIFIFRNKKLYTTYSLKEYEFITNILNQNNISYIHRVKDLSSPNLFEVNRGTRGTFGMNQDSSKEYSIYVKKDVYESAKHIINKM